MDILNPGRLPGPQVPRMNAAEVLSSVALTHPGSAAMVRELAVGDRRTRGGYRRIDGLLITGQRLIAVEVKVSRADFRRDTDEKRAPWRSITHQFTYVVPWGLVGPEEVPPGIGLWYARPGMPVRRVRHPRVNRNPSPLPFEVFKRVAYRAGKIGSDGVDRAQRSR